ncbi:hypothetical protein MKW98_021071 [Papaver atlanticum]|uniref:Uncharacterized protein n=1 Tax=Papaver atlanticum TaxID=357466 RepID=A0AAD4TA29_9MAGN|nr:hypothetical protein MKW98_021071 [Papaver atlanticum]
MAPIGAIVSTKSKTNHNILSSSSIFETVKGFHEYNIKGYSLAKGMGVGKYRSSHTFTVGGHDWAINFYPDGKTQDNQEYVSLFVELVSPGEAKAMLEFKLLDQSRKGKHDVRGTSECAKVFDREGTIWLWGYMQYMKRSELETSSYLKDDCLTIHCTIGVVQTRDEEGKRYIAPIPSSDMAQNFKSLLESGIGSDITLHVGNEFFRAHKSVLAARSPVFRAQFFGLVGNPADMKTVTIEEVEPFAFKAMLLFLYSDELPEACEYSDSDSPCTLTTFMQHLLAAADRYDLPRLKVMCEEKLCEEITVDNVATTLHLAEKHQCLQLKTICLNFAAKPENLGEIIKSDGYANLEKSLLTDLLKTCAGVVQK